MYDIQVEAKEFKGKRTVLQHRMINEVTDHKLHSETCFARPFLMGK